jgi:hypothetical protein
MRWASQASRAAVTSNVQRLAEREPILTSKPGRWPPCWLLPVMLWLCGVSLLGRHGPLDHDERMSTSSRCMLGVSQLHRGHRSHERRNYHAVDLMLQIDRFAGISEPISPGRAVGDSSATVAAIFVSCPRPIIGVSSFRRCSGQGVSTRLSGCRQRSSTRALRWSTTPSADTAPVAEP